MKHLKFAVISALFLSVFAITGCELFKQVEELTTDKWCQKTVTYTKATEEEDAKTLDVYFIWATEEDSDKGIVKGLNVLVQAEGKAVSILGAEVTSGQYYYIFNIGENKKIEDLEGADLAETDAIDAEKKKLIMSQELTSSKWAAAYIACFNKDSRNVGTPAALKGGNWLKIGTLNEDFSLKQVVAEALLDTLLG